MSCFPTPTRTIARRLRDPLRADWGAAPALGTRARGTPVAELVLPPDEARARCGCWRPLRPADVGATGPVVNIEDVPTISRFFGITITMYHDDHGRPHFHARHADGSARIRIAEVEVIDSSLGRRQLRLVLAWAELHREELLENWQRARAHETLNKIEPLQ